MKQTATSSQYTFIMDDLKHGKFIRTYKKDGISGYRRYVPLNKMYELLDTTQIKHPKILRNRLFYIDIEFIDGKNLESDFDNNILTNIFCNSVFELSKVDTTSINKYCPYNTPTEFYNATIDNLIMVMDKLKNYDYLERFGIRRDSLLNLKNVKMDDSRKLQLIHCDISKGNIISKNNEYYLIDWELACKGDIAYEVCEHLMVNKYSDEEKSIIIDRIGQYFGYDIEAFKRDIEIYIKFEKFRKCCLKFNRAINLAKKGKDFDKVLLDGYEYYKDIVNLLTYDNISGELQNLSK